MYVAERAKLNRCKQDNDCAEMWPGYCPYGPYYIHRQSNLDILVKVTRQMRKVCPDSRCAKPRRLGPAVCRAGKCVKGRKPPRKGGVRSCWDCRETYLEYNYQSFATAHKSFTGKTPRHALGVDAPGMLEVEIKWQNHCQKAVMVISEHNPGMANKKKGRRNRTGNRESIKLKVRPGLYYFIARGTDWCSFYFTVKKLARDDGKPARTTHHGVSWQRRCEK
jgi:hypothetical protein